MGVTISGSIYSLYSLLHSERAALFTMWKIIPESSMRNSTPFHHVRDLRMKRCDLLGATAAEWLALPLHSKKILGSISGLDRAKSSLNFIMSGSGFLGLIREHKIKIG